MTTADTFFTRFCWRLALVIGITSLSASGAPTTAPFPAACQAAIDQLGSDDPSARQSAEDYLVAQGRTATAALQSATSDPRPEVQLLARRALRTGALFRLPGIPDEVFSIAQAYLNGKDFDHRKPQLNRLFQVQPQPNVVLTRLITLETDDDLRRQMLYQLATGYREAVPRMLVDDDDLTGVLNVLDSSAEMWGGANAADDATARLLCGQLDDQIAISSAEQINGDTVSQERAAARLCFLYRVCGKYDQALKYARLSRDPSLVFLVLQDQGDWSTAAREPDTRWRDPIASAAYRAAFQRLAGHPQTAVDLLSPLVGNAPQDTDGSFTPSRFFLLNDLPVKGIQLLTDLHPAVAFEMRLERGEIAGAIAIADQYQNQPTDAPELAQLHLALRQSLGELPEPATQADPSSTIANPTTENAWLEATEKFRQKKYQLAAEEFAQLWSKDQSRFASLYLEGYSLNKIGQVSRGQALMDKAAMLPLGDPLARWKLAADLDAEGLSDEADRQNALGLQGGGSFDEVGFSEILNTRAARAMDQKQWSAAADALDRLCLMNLSPGLQWHDPVRLLTIPALAHLVKARQAIASRDVTTAMQELSSYSQYLPMSSDMVLEVVPALDQLGEHEKADQIFSSVYEKLSAICETYPRSITYLNELAWMSACCDRRLDQALKAAQTTVKLEPGNWQVLDTLAEVNFRRGDRSMAVDLERHAMSMTTDPYVARQVNRFETASIPPTTQPGVAPQ